MRGRAGLMRGPSARCISNKLEGAGFGKMNYNAPVDHSDHPRQTLSDNMFNVIIIVDLAIDLAGVDRPDQERGPSAHGRNVATVRKVVTLL
jgi:hypothetical protein